MENNIQVLGTQEIDGKGFTQITGGFGPDKKAMLVNDIAKIHGQPVGNVNRLINDNRNRFKDSVDIIDFLNAPDAFRDLAKENGWVRSNRTKNVYLLSERGYSKLLKLLEDDLSWDIYDKLLDEYFQMKEKLEPKHSVFVDVLRDSLESVGLDPDDIGFWTNNLVYIPLLGKKGLNSVTKIAKDKNTSIRGHAESLGKVHHIDSVVDQVVALLSNGATPAETKSIIGRTYQFGKTLNKRIKEENKLATEKQELE